MNVNNITSHFFTELPSFFIYDTHNDFDIADPSSTQDAGRMSYLNLVYGPARHESFVAQWLEHLTGVRKVIRSIPVGDADFSVSHARGMLITSLLISSLS